jgi:hypothetical protein
MTRGIFSDWSMEAGKGRYDAISGSQLGTNQKEYGSVILTQESGRHGFYEGILASLAIWQDGLAADV